MPLAEPRGPPVPEPAQSPRPVPPTCLGLHQPRSALVCHSWACRTPSCRCNEREGRGARSSNQRAPRAARSPRSANQRAPHARGAVALAPLRWRRVSALPARPNRAAAAALSQRNLIFPPLFCGILSLFFPGLGELPVLGWAGRRSRGRGGFGPALGRCR